MAISLSLLSSVRGQIKWEKGQRGKEKRKKTNEMKQIQQKQTKIKREGGACWGREKENYNYGQFSGILRSSHLCCEKIEQNNYA